MAYADLPAQKFKSVQSNLSNVSHWQMITELIPESLRMESLRLKECSTLRFLIGIVEHGLTMTKRKHNSAYEILRAGNQVTDIIMGYGLVSLCYSMDSSWILECLSYLSSSPPEQTKELLVKTFLKEMNLNPTCHEWYMFHCEFHRKQSRHSFPAFVAELLLPWVDDWTMMNMKSVCADWYHRLQSSIFSHYSFRYQIKSQDIEPKRKMIGLLRCEPEEKTLDIDILNQEHPWSKETLVQHSKVFESLYGTIQKMEHIQSIQNFIPENDLEAKVYQELRCGQSVFVSSYDTCQDKCLFVNLYIFSNHESSFVKVELNEIVTAGLISTRLFLTFSDQKQKLLIGSWKDDDHYCLEFTHWHGLWGFIFGNSEPLTSYFDFINCINRILFGSRVIEQSINRRRMMFHNELSLFHLK